MRLKRVLCVVLSGLLLIPSLAAAATQTTNSVRVGSSRTYTAQVGRNKEGRVRGMNQSSNTTNNSVHRLWACNLSYTTPVIPNNAIVSSTTITLKPGTSQTGAYQKNPLRQTPKYLGIGTTGLILCAAGYILNPFWRASINSAAASTVTGVSWVDGR